MPAVPRHLQCRECGGRGYIAIRDEFQSAEWVPCSACDSTGNMTGDGELRPLPPYPPDSFVK